MMEQKLDRLIDLVVNMQQEFNEFRAETSARFTQIDDRFTQVDQQFASIGEEFARVHQRLDTLELKSDHILSETRSYFKRIDDRTDTVERVVKQLSYKSEVHEAHYEKLKDQIEDSH